MLRLCFVGSRESRYFQVSPLGPGVCGAPRRQPWLLAALRSQLDGLLHFPNPSPAAAVAFLLFRARLRETILGHLFLSECKVRGLVQETPVFPSPVTGDQDNVRKPPAYTVLSSIFPGLSAKIGVSESIKRKETSQSR